MASGAYQAGIAAVADGRIDLDTTTLKIMALKSTYTYDPDHNFVDDLTASEIVATNYAGGFGGAGRKTATLAISLDNTNNKVIITITDLTWTALGGATNDTIGGFALIREITNDPASLPICFFDVTNLTTNGGDVTLDFAAAGDNGGNIQLAM